MPFTLAHAAAVLPMRRLKLVWSAVVIGTFAPDFSLFLALHDPYRDSHRWPQLLTFALPMALLSLWLFHRLLKRPLIELAPEGVRLRLVQYTRPFPFLGMRRFAAIVGSILLGMATHVLWDTFTHPYTWAYYRWDWLQEPTVYTLFGELHVTPHFKMLQLLSSALGCLAVAAWVAVWYRDTTPAEASRRPVFPSGWRLGIAGTLLLFPWVVGTLLALQNGYEGLEFLHINVITHYLVLLPASLLTIEVLLYSLFTTRILRLEQAERS